MENQNGKTGFSTVCQKCGRTIYEGEMLNINGKYVCEPCADRCVFGDFSREPHRKRRVPSAFFHFIVSFMPGAGQMYLGLMKRGLFQMCLFFFCCYLASTASPMFFGMLIPIVCIYSFFDSLALRRHMVDGDEVQDELGGIADFISANKGLIIAAIVIMMACGMFSSVISVVRNYAVRGPVPSSRSVEVYIDETVDGAVNAIEESTSRAYNSTIIYSPFMPFKWLTPLFAIAIGGLIVLKSGRKKGKRGGDAPKHKSDTAPEVYDVYDSNDK